MKTIVIECGTTIEDGYSGSVGSLGSGRFYRHALHAHANCTTVDINE